MLHKIKRLLKKGILKLKYPHVINHGEVAWGSKFEGPAMIGRGSAFTGSMGRCSYMALDCKINARIGAFCSIASNVKTVIDTHPIRNFVSTSPVFYSTGKQCGTTYVKKSQFDEQLYADAEKRYGVIIGNDVWIGENVLILGGVSIGNGSVIAAGAVVTKNVEPYSIVGGVPAKEIRKRFSKEQIDFLQSFEWWNKDEKWIQENAFLFTDIKKLMSHEGVVEK